MLKVYSTNCPKCKILEKRLNSLNKDFEIIDDLEEVYKVATELGIKEAPFVMVDEKVYNFIEIFDEIFAVIVKFSSPEIFAEIKAF